MGGNLTNHWKSVNFRICMETTMIMAMSREALNQRRLIGGTWRTGYLKGYWHCIASVPARCLFGGVCSWGFIWRLSWPSALSVSLHGGFLVHEFNNQSINSSSVIAGKYKVFFLQRKSFMYRFGESGLLVGVPSLAHRPSNHYLKSGFVWRYIRVLESL